MYKIFLLIPLFFLSSIAYGAVISSEKPKSLLSKEFCQSLMTAHTPDADVAYHADVDAYGQEVPSADLENATKLQLPKIIPIPIKVDLGAYLRNSPPAKFQQTYTNLNKNAQNVGQNNTTIQQNTTTIANNSTTVNNSLQQINSLIQQATTAQNTAVAANPAANTTKLAADPQALTTLYNTAISSLASNVNNLMTVSQTIVNNVDTLKNSLTQLSNQVSPRETNTYVLQTNAELTKQSQSDLQSTLGGLTNLSSSFSSTQSLLTNTLNSIQANASQLGTSNVASLTGTLTTLQNSLNNATSTAQSTGTLAAAGSSSSPQQTAANSLINSFQALQAQQNQNVSQPLLQSPLEADLGQVTYNMESGELLYNGQPLEAGQQTQLKKECEKILEEG